MSSVATAHEMFSHCTRLKKIFCDKAWRLDDILFFNCPNLSGAIVFNRDKYSGYLYANPTTGYFTPTSFTSQRACAVWCDDKATLYFTSTRKPYHIGDSLNGATITDYWWCDDVTDCTALGRPVWFNATITLSSFKNVVFTESFSQAEEKVKTTRGWFEGCTALKSIEGWEYFDTSNVTDMGRMFCRCEGIESLEEINLMNTSNVTDMDSLFFQCRNLAGLDLTNFNTDNVRNMGDMFARCYALTSIDLTNFNTASVENFKEMFYYCTALQTIYCNSTWNKDIPSKDMFYRCEKLKGAVAYENRKVDAAYANPDNGYFTKIELYDLWIAGTQVSSRNCGDLTVIDGVSITSDEGYFYYDPAANILRIKDGMAVSQDDYALHSNIKDLTIESGQDGTVLLQSFNGNAVMFVEKRVYITGGVLAVVGGTLLNPSTQGILAKHNVRVEDGMLITFGTYGISGYYDFVDGTLTYFGGLSVRGQSAVSAYGSKACILMLGSFSLGDDVRIVEPEGAEFYKHNICLNGEVVKDTWVNIMYEERRIKGDVNGDGMVDISDIVAIINTIAGDTTYKDTANVNEDDNVDISDIVAVINIIAQ